VNPVSYWRRYKTPNRINQTDVTSFVERCLLEGVAGTASVISTGQEYEHYLHHYNGGHSIFYYA